MSALAPPKRFSDRLLALFGVRLVVWVLAGSVFLGGVLIDPVGKVSSYHDEHNTVMHEEAARKTWGDYGQIPAWNPYFCGGIVGIANAPDASAAPDFILRIVYGTLAGRRIAALLFVILGMEGVFRYARRHHASVLGAAMAGVAFAACAHFVNLVLWGWIFMFNYNLVPWAILGLEEGMRRRRWWIIGGAAMAWIVLGGGTYVAPYAGLALLFCAIAETARALRRADGDESVPWHRPWTTLLKMAAIAVGLSALRLIPLMSVLSQHSRPVDQKDLTAPLAAFAMLALKRSDGWHANAGDYYVGLFVFALAMFALVATDRRGARFFAIACVFTAFACGEVSEHAPYMYLHKLPIYSQLRAPDRMLTLAALFLALAGARGVTVIEDWITGLGDRVHALVRRRQGLPVNATTPLTRFAMGGIGAVVAGSIAWAAAKDVVETNFVHPNVVYTMDGPQRRPAEFQMSRGNRWDAHVWPYIDMGSAHCFEEHALFTSPLIRGDLERDEYPAPDAKDMTVERVSWSPEKIVVKVHAPSGGRFLVNQNHNAAWRTDVGELDSDGGLISVRVPPGDHVVTVAFRDYRMWFGVLVSLGTLGWMLYLAQKAARSRAAAWARLWRLAR